MADKKIWAKYLFRKYFLWHILFLFLRRTLKKIACTRHTDIATYGLNRSRSRFIENIYIALQHDKKRVLLLSHLKYMYLDTQRLLPGKNLKPLYANQTGKILQKLQTRFMKMFSVAPMFTQMFTLRAMNTYNCFKGKGLENK